MRGEACCEVEINDIQRDERVLSETRSESSDTEIKRGRWRKLRGGKGEED